MIYTRLNSWGIIMGQILGLMKRTNGHKMFVKTIYYLSFIHNLTLILNNTWWKIWIWMTSNETCNIFFSKMFSNYLDYLKFLKESSQP